MDILTIILGIIASLLIITIVVMVIFLIIFTLLIWWIYKLIKDHPMGALFILIILLGLGIAGTIAGGFTLQPEIVLPSIISALGSVTIIVKEWKKLKRAF
jgi:hypothetical protein